MEEYENEEESQSVESGSCTCSEYNSDCSWFYDSRDLATSYMRFSIINEYDDSSSKNEKSLSINKEDNYEPLMNEKDPYLKKNNYNNYNYNNYYYNDLNNYPQNPNFYPEKFGDYEHNFRAPLEEDNLYDKNFNYNNPPTNFENKRRFYKNLKNEDKAYNFNKAENKSPLDYYKEETINEPFSDEENIDEENNDSNVEIINKSFQSKGKTINEKIIKEVKTITLDGGETIKPKIITKEKLKPNIVIVKNDDGTKSKAIENTVLTTVIVNEIVDPSTLYDDDYSKDVQVVKQYITKIYKTEIEKKPYP